MREQLYTAIYDDTNWLINMTENLLAATQLETDRTKLQNRVPNCWRICFKVLSGSLDRQGKRTTTSLLIWRTRRSWPSMNARTDSAGHHQHDEQRDPIYAQGLTYHSERRPEGRTGCRSASLMMAPGSRMRRKSTCSICFILPEQGKADCQRGLGLGLQSLPVYRHAMHGGTITVSDHSTIGDNIPVYPSRGSDRRREISVTRNGGIY